jgi:hypothetical protein
MQMTILEELTISHWYALFARTLTTAATNPSLSPEQTYALTAASRDCANQSSNLATQLVQTTFQNAGQAFQDISDAASKANEVAKTLASNAAAANNLLNIAAKLVALGTAAATGNYGAALTDLISLVGTPTQGQGAQDPLAS